MYGGVDSLYNIGITAYTFCITTMISASILILMYTINGKLRFTQRQFLTLTLLIVYFTIYLVATRINVPQALEGLCIPIVLFYILKALYEGKNKLLLALLQDQWKAICVLFSKKEGFIDL